MDEKITITVDDASGFREARRFDPDMPLIVRVGEEYMMVKDIDGDTLTVVDAREWLESSW